MARKPSLQPTEVELAILKVLWDKGPSSVRQVHNALKTNRNAGYSTTLKMMQVMFGKGLLIRDESQRPQIYRAVKPEQQTQSQLLEHLMQKVFGGSMQKLVLNAIQSRKISPNEVEEIRQLLKKHFKK